MESELLFIFLLALILLGPRKLPELGRMIGKAMAEFKRAKNEFTSQIESEVRRLEEESSKLLPAESNLLAESTNTIQPPTQAPAGTVTSSGEATSAPSVNGAGASQETHA
jgi:TatA/E family protein of Tat protein translocase